MSFVALLKRELFVYFVTPLAWVLLTAFLVVQGMHFYVVVDHLAQAPPGAALESPISAFFGNTVLLYLVLFLLVPAMTMRTFAEERRSGTIETLMTAPVRPTSVVLAKYVAALFTYAVMWAPTALYVVILRRAGAVDGHVVASAYFGVALVGAAYLAVGTLMSALTRSQFLALVLTALVILGLFVVGIGEFVTREGSLAHAVSSHVSVWAHMNDFSSGIVDTRHVVFYVTLTVLSLSSAVRVVESWRWRG